MKLISFLDVICCALISSIIVFQLQSTGRLKPHARGRTFVAYVQVENGYAVPGGTLEVEVYPTLKGKTLAPIRLPTPYDGRTIDLRHGLHARLPDLSSSGAESRFSVAIFGRIDDRGEVRVVVRQQSRPDSRATLLDTLKNEGVQRLEFLLGDNVLPGLRERNRDALARLSRCFAEQRLAAPPGNVLDKGWLEQNCLALLGDKEGVPLAARRGVATSAQHQRMLRKSHDFDTHFSLLVYLLGRGSRLALPLNLRAQEVVANLCFVGYLTGRPVTQTKLEEMMRGAELGPDNPRPNGLAAPVDLLAQVHAWLDVHQPGLGDLVLGKGVARDVWNTGWRPPQKPGDEGWEPLAYRLGQPSDLVADLERAMAASSLTPVSHEELAAFAHGAMFYDYCLMRLRGWRAQADVFDGSDRRAVPTREFEFDIDPNGNIEVRSPRLRVR